jgi:hypothetical protein
MVKFWKIYPKNMSTTCSCWPFQDTLSKTYNTSLLYLVWFLCLETNYGTCLWDAWPKQNRGHTMKIVHWKDMPSIATCLFQWGHPPHVIKEVKCMSCWVLTLRFKGCKGFLPSDHGILWVVNNLYFIYSHQFLLNISVKFLIDLQCVDN